MTLAKEIWYDHTMPREDGLPQPAPETPLQRQRRATAQIEALWRETGEGTLQAKVAKAVKSKTHSRKQNNGEGYQSIDITDLLSEGQTEIQRVFCKWGRQNGPTQSLNVVREAVKHTWIRAGLNNRAYGLQRNIKIPKMIAYGDINNVEDEFGESNYKVIFYEHLELKTLGEIFSEENAQELIPAVVNILKELHDPQVVAAIPPTSGYDTGFERYTPENYQEEAIAWADNAIEVVGQGEYQALQDYLEGTSILFDERLIHGDAADHNLGVLLDKNQAIDPSKKIVPLDLEKSKIGCMYEDYARLLHRFMTEENLRGEGDKYLHELITLLVEDPDLFDSEDEEKRHEQLAVFKYMRIYKALFLANHWAEKSKEAPELSSDHHEDGKTAPDYQNKSKKWLDRAQLLALSDDSLVIF